MMWQVTVQLAERSYPIYIGAGLLDDAALVRRHVKGRKVCIISNTTVGPIYCARLIAALSDLEVTYLELPDGEQFKTMETLNSIFDHLLEHRYDRQATLIALGGGVVGDMVGFAAACYQRGVDFLQVPTTLLAQVDSSVGGKTGVNHPRGKNMIGAFKQPACVLIDTLSLNTLPPRELKAGMAEVIKHGAISDAEFFSWLELNLDAVLALEPAAIAHTVCRNCEIKAQVVSADEKEQGIRAWLNYGHTFGHAIETAMGYGQWLHGEAVAAGMVMAADLATRLNILDAGQSRRLKTLVARAGLPVKPPQIDPLKFLDLMRHDKKVSAGEIRFVLLDRLGQARLHSGVDAAQLKATLSAGDTLCCH